MPGAVNAGHRKAPTPMKETTVPALTVVEEQLSPHAESILRAMDKVTDRVALTLTRLATQDAIDGNPAAQTTAYQLILLFGAQSPEDVQFDSAWADLVDLAAERSGLETGSTDACCDVFDTSCDRFTHPELVAEAVDRVSADMDMYAHRLLGVG